MSGVLEAVRRVNLPGRVERSGRLRASVLASVMVATVAIGFSGAAPAGDVVVGLVLLPVGAWLSRARAGLPNLGLKALLALAAVAALLRFFGDVRDIQTVEFARQPLAGLFVAVQVLHGFDLPARRDLGFTLASSLTLIALAATSTFASWFLAALMLYAGISVVALLEMQRSAARQRAEELSLEHDLQLLADHVAPPAGSPGAATSAPAWIDSLRTGDLQRTLRVAGTIVLLGALVFSLVPRGGTRRLGGLEFRGLPSSLRLPSGLVRNDGLDGGGQADPVEGEIPLDYNPTAYFGFAQNVDLRTVGTPSDIDVLRVQADRPRFWRGMVFDEYTGLGWSRSDQVPDAVQGTPVELPGRNSKLADYDTVVQTYELLADTPNLVFVAADPVQIFVGGGSVNPWPDGTISTGQTMDLGTVYSVVSRIDVTPVARLRLADGAVPPTILETYTQLPRALPQRVHDLAAELTAGLATPYAKAEAIEDWIGANTEYRLDVEPPPLVGDVVDHFLFESRQGWCEPIASSMVVLLRSVGVPARFSTGFQPGRRNPVTGVFDVKMENAHAWVEVWIPGHGWIEFDPTGAVPQAVAGDVGLSIPLLDLLVWAREVLVPPFVKDGLSAVGSLARDQWPVTLVLLTAAGASVFVVRRARREAAWALRPPWDRLERLLADDGIHRTVDQTPRQFAEVVRRRRPDLDATSLATLLAHEEHRRYGAPKVAAADAEVALARLRGARVGNPA